MKTYFKILFILSLTSFFTAGCDPSEVVEKLTTVTISTDFPQTYAVSVPGEGPSELTLARTIRASGNEDVEQFESRIDSYEVDSMTIKITDYHGAENISLDEATMAFKNSVGENIVDPAVFITAEDHVNLMTYSNSGSVIKLTFEDAMAEAIAESFKAEQEITVEVTASVDGQPVDFNIETILYVKVEGSIMQMQ